MRKQKAKKIRNQVKRSYSQIAEDFSNTRNYYGKEFEIFWKYLQKAGSLADIGCGNGRFAGFLKEKKKDIHYLGIDRSPEMVDIARKKNPEYVFMEGDILALPLDNECVDAVVCLRTLHHVPSRKLREQAINELERILKKGGVLIVSVWNLWQKKYRWELAKAIFRSIVTLGAYDYNDAYIPWSSKTKRYYHAFTRAELKRLLKKTDMEIIGQPQITDVKDHIFILKK